MRAGDTAKVNSPTFPPSRGVCYVRLWYYMYGSSTMGPLNVRTFATLNKVKSQRLH